MCWWSSVYDDRLGTFFEWASVRNKIRRSPHSVRNIYLSFGRDPDDSYEKKYTIGSNQIFFILTVWCICTVFHLSYELKIGIIIVNNKIARDVWRSLQETKTKSQLNCENEKKCRCRWNNFNLKINNTIFAFLVA